MPYSLKCQGWYVLDIPNYSTSLFILTPIYSQARNCPKKTKVFIKTKIGSPTDSPIESTLYSSTNACLLIDIVHKSYICLYQKTMH